jgi:glycosyltransferase involved in cell wall biosynthesis
MKTSPVKVTHLASGDLWGGAEAQIYSLVKHLSLRSDTEVSVILLNDGALAQKILALKIPLVIVEESKHSAIEIYRAVSKQIKRWQTQIVHTHRVKENVIGALAARQNRCRSIRSVHGAQEHKATLFRPDRWFIYKLDMLIGRFLQEKIVAVSNELSNALCEQYSSNNVLVINNGIDLNDIKPFERNIETKASKHLFKIGFVGRLVPVKRVDLFIESASFLVKQNKNFKFLIYGDGPLKRALKQQIKELNLDNYVLMKGHVDNIHQAIADLDLMVITSDHEGLPISLLEAMAIGTPVVARSVGAIPEVLDYGSCGRLIDTPTIESITHQILHSINHSKVTNQQVIAAKKRVKEYYTATKNAAEFAKLYQMLINMPSKLRSISVS